METDNSRKLEWKKVFLKGAPAVDGHCSSVVNDEIYIFGGVVRANHDFCESNKLSVVSLGREKFEVLNVSGDVPCTRSCATMAAVNRKLYLFGGLNGERGWLNDIHLFDTDTRVWKKLETSGPKPSPRDKVASAVVGSRIYFFGGFGPLSEVQVEKVLRCQESSDEDDSGDDEEDKDDDRSAKFGWFNDLYMLDTASKTWWQIPLTSCHSPSPRAACTMCPVEKCLAVFGGRDKHGRCNDLYIFDTDLLEWPKVTPPTGFVPEPRSFHSAVSVGKYVIIVGGMSQEDKHLADVYVYDSEKSHWSKYEVGDEFRGRGSFTLNIVKDSLVAYGGSADFNKEISQCCTLFDEFFILSKNFFTGIRNK